MPTDPDISPPIVMGTKKPHELRQRTPHACDNCRRRKQKCDGLNPCKSCIRREFNCTYQSSEPPTPNTLPIVGTPSNKRRHLGTASDQPDNASSATRGHDNSRSPVPNEHGLGNLGKNPASDQDEEAHVYGQSRLMLDYAGRVLYVGDSATLSYLQSIRLVVESEVGESPFTQDPDRHRFIEPPLTTTETTQNVPMLPEKRVADILTESFFTSTLGMINIFDRRAFQHELNACYASPLTTDRPNLVLIYLVLAIGLVTATPTPGSPECDVISQLCSQPTDRAEIFFRSAKSYGDPLRGFEDGDLWSVQALCLMSFYMLVISKPNAAHTYLGMAIQSAQVLGLHKANETDMIFEGGQPQLNFQRRIVWRSLFILDRFLAMSLGRPLAISEDDCSDDSLKAPEVRPCTAKKLRQEQILNMHGLDSGIQASRAIGQSLKKMYSKGKISTRIAEEIVEDCRRWAEDLHVRLDASMLSDAETVTTYGAAILQVLLLGYHSIILLTRPFFLHLLIKADNSEPSLAGQSSRMKQFSETCVVTSIYTIQLAQTVLASGSLPRRNPFVIYFIFSAALILLSNEFACLHDNSEYTESVSDAIDIMSHCATTDFQARGFHRILSEFREVVRKRTQLRTQGSPNLKLHPGDVVEMPAVPSSNPAEGLPSSSSSIKGTWNNSLVGTGSVHRTLKPDISQISHALMGSRGMLSVAVGHPEHEGPEARIEDRSHSPIFRTITRVLQALEHKSDMEIAASLQNDLEARFEELWKLLRSNNS